MKSKLKLATLGLCALILVGCATTKGAILGAGVGYVLGDTRMGASIGATAGMIKDIWD